MNTLEIAFNNPAFVHCYNNFVCIREFLNKHPEKLPQALVELNKSEAFMVFYILGVLND